MEHQLAETLTSLTLLVLVALAVRQDLKERRISNVLTFVGLAIALALHAMANGTQGFLHALAGAGVGLVCFLPLYLCKGMGAGDVKLMSAAGAFLGPLNALVAAMLSLASGAVLALVVLAWRAVELRSAAAGTSPGEPGSSTMSQLRKERFPYAAAIAFGVVLTMWLRGMLEELVP